MTAEISVDTADDDATLAEFAAVDAEAFADDAASTERWFRAAGPGVRVRVARIGGAVAGGYGLYTAKQHFGGREVPAECVITVAVAPRFRRAGVAATLLRDLVEQAAAKGGALAPLTASTTRLYRRWGWEVGGRHVNQRVRTDMLSAFRGAGAIVDEPGLDEVAGLRAEVLSAWDGPLDRPPGWVDLAATQPTPESVDRHRRIGWAEDGRLTGYLRYESTRGDAEHWIIVRVHEFVASTPGALHGLFGFLGGFEAQSPDVTFAHTCVPLDGPLLQLIPDADKRIRLEGRICWMQRIVDLRRAVESRGWRGSDCSVALEISDPMETEPRRFVLEVNSGQGSLAEGGDGRVRLGIGALSAWYAGTLPALHALRYGLLQGPPEDAAQLDAALGVSRPWMPDFF